MSNVNNIGTKQKVITFGVFDCLHKGHLSLLEQAKALGDYLVVVVARDSYVRVMKNKEPVVSEEARMKIVQKVGCVDRVLLGDEWPVKDKFGLLSRLNFDVLALGYDQRHSEASIIERLKTIGKENVKVFRLKPFAVDKYKSSFFRK